MPQRAVATAALRPGATPARRRMPDTALQPTEEAPMPDTPDTPAPTVSPHSPSRRSGLRRIALAGAALAAGPGRSTAQPAFPGRPITLVVPFAPAGIADLSARTVAEPLGRRLGQPVVVDNRPGAGGIVGAVAVARAPADGHTLLLMSNANAVSAALFRQLAYDPVRDFSPVGTLGRFDLALFAAAGGRFGTLREAIAFARAHPGELNIGCISVGSTQHLAAKLFETQAGLSALVVPYRGTPAVLTALRSGEVDLAVEILGPMLPQLAGGAVRALALAAEQRHPLLPELPTAQQAGLAGFVVASWNGIAAPAGTPAAVVERLNRTLREVLADPGVAQRLGVLGMRLAAGPPAELQALLASEIRRWGAVIKAAKIEPE